MLTDICSVSGPVLGAFYKPFCVPFSRSRRRDLPNKRPPPNNERGQPIINGEPCEGKPSSLKVLKCFSRSFSSWNPSRPHQKVPFSLLLSRR